MQIADSKRLAPDRNRDRRRTVASDGKGNVRTLSGFRRPARTVPMSVCLSVLRACVPVGLWVVRTSSDVMGIHGAQLALNVSVEGDDIKKESGMDPLGRAYCGRAAVCSPPIPTPFPP